MSNNNHSSDVRKGRPRRRSLTEADSKFDSEVSQDASRKVQRGASFSAHTPPVRRKEAYLYNVVPRSLAFTKDDEDSDEDAQRIRRAQGIPYDEDFARKNNERDAIQKKTFTKWVNKHLKKRYTCITVCNNCNDGTCSSPVAGKQVRDLFEDLRDGHSLISLLEVLSGEHLPRERGRLRFHMLQNVQLTLDFLRYRKIKLVNIRCEDIVDGNPKLILGLIWTIILHFQVSSLLYHYTYFGVYFKWSYTWYRNYIVLKFTSRIWLYSWYRNYIVLEFTSRIPFYSWFRNYIVLEFTPRIPFYSWYRNYIVLEFT
ncbi:uncharacterized protein [Palaemon carinicauda]|uniref:uncharacterized protein n=1 Tax=Palaemon carinicauda TaxID=392227 RepID=UPI0035B5EF0A